MLEVCFVVGFFAMLMATGISLAGVIAALFVASLAMLIGGMFVMLINLLPWLLLAVAAVWLWRNMKNKPLRHR
ncbi:envelope stress response protein PspG [Affinibrenneria salicis]|uniref:Envelope stress response protein PspG n=1 Tax=Affinibrenneria salicis TaxID=2590031 RepID=A0A5J5G5W2_9GAMM|nr:envelope stress response protein PspG [Affinibrenneria salicis]KAA9002557.1 envelope stress response protein PspG [Affinibrenneria salicis]KAA9003155.1 envelope stress response protein PspG [Affinibrenneria salicis]